MVACIEYLTLNILMRQTTLHGAFTYQGLVCSAYTRTRCCLLQRLCAPTTPAHHACRAHCTALQVKHGLGKAASEFMAWTILFFIFGSCVAYIIIVGDTFGAVWNDIVVGPLGLPPIVGNRALVILVPALTVMLPISLQRSMLSLAPASTVALGVMIFTTGAAVCPTSAAARTSHAPGRAAFPEPRTRCVPTTRAHDRRHNSVCRRCTSTTCSQLPGDQPKHRRAMWQRCTCRNKPSLSSPASRAQYHITVHSMCNRTYARTYVHTPAVIRCSLMLHGTWYTMQTLHSGRPREPSAASCPHSTQHAHRCPMHGTCP